MNKSTEKNGINKEKTNGKKRMEQKKNNEKYPLNFLFFLPAVVLAVDANVEPDPPPIPRPIPLA